MDWYLVLLAVTAAVRGLGAGLIYHVAWDRAGRHHLHKEQTPGRILFIKAVGITQDKPDWKKVKIKWAFMNHTHAHPISDREWRYNVSA